MARKASNYVKVSVPGVDPKGKPAKLGRIVRYELESPVQEWSRDVLMAVARSGYASVVRAMVQRYHDRYFGAHQMLKEQFRVALKEFGDSPEIRAKLARIPFGISCPIPADAEFPTDFVVGIGAFLVRDVDSALAYLTPTATPSGKTTSAASAADVEDDDDVEDEEDEDSVFEDDAADDDADAE